MTTVALFVAGIFLVLLVAWRFVFPGGKPLHTKIDLEVKPENRCRYCDRPGGFPVPQLKLRLPLFDSLYRRLGMVPMRQWYLDVEPEVDVPSDLCLVHQTMARGHLERELAKGQVEYAEFCDQQLQRLHSYGEQGLHARMEEDARRKS